MKLSNICFILLFGLATSTVTPPVNNATTAAPTTQPAVNNETTAAPTTQPAVNNATTAAPTTIPVDNSTAAPTAQPAVNNETTAAPTTQPAVNSETTAAPTTQPAVNNETTAAPTTQPAVNNATTAAPTTIPVDNSTAAPTAQPAVNNETTAAPTTQPAVNSETTAAPTTQPAVNNETTAAPTTQPAVNNATTAAPTTIPVDNSTAAPTAQPAVNNETTAAPTTQPAVNSETTAAPTTQPAVNNETTAAPTTQPAVNNATTAAPTTIPVDNSTAAPTAQPAVNNETTAAPTTIPVDNSTAAPTAQPAVNNETTAAPTTQPAVNNETTAAPTTQPAVNNATTAAPTTIPVNNSTAAPTTQPAVNNETTAAPTTIPVDNSTAAPTAEPAVNNTTTAAPATVPVENSTAAPTTQSAVNNETTAAPTTIPVDNSTAAPTTQAAVNNETTAAPTTIPVDNSTAAPTTQAAVNNETTAAPTTIPVDNSTAAPTTQAPVNNTSTAAPATVPVDNSTAAPTTQSAVINAVRVETVFKVTNMAFSVQLLNKSSTDFQSLQQTIKSELSSLFPSQITNINVVQVRAGSIKTTTEFDVIKRDESSVSNVNSLLRNKVNLGVLGTLRFDKTIYSFNIKGIGCGPPNVTITNLASSPDPPTRIKRSEGYIVQTEVKMNCNNFSSTSFFWSVWQLKPLGRDYVLASPGKPTFVLQGTAEWNIKKNTFDYGLFLVEFRVGMKNSQGILTSSDLRFFEITQSRIVAGIIGGSHVKRGFNQDVKIDASASYDPDVNAGDFSGMTFTWFCKKKDESFPIANMPIVVPSDPKGSGGCFDTGIGKLNSDQRIVTLDTGDMLVDNSYTIKLVISKAIGRESEFIQNLDVVKGDPPQISIRCRINCGQKVNPSSRIKVTTNCVAPSKTCTLPLRYQWTLKTKRVENSVDLWIDVQKIHEKFSTPLTSPDAVIKEDVLDPDQEYQLTVQAEYPGVASGISSYIFKTNSPPKGGSCHITPLSGTGLETPFQLTCQGWHDADNPLNYQFYYVTEPGLTSVISYGQDKQVKSKLPVGKKEKGYTVTIYILIIDSLAAFTKQEINVKVEPIKPGSGNNIKTAVDEASKEVDALLKTGDVKKATQLANAALETMTNANKDEIDDNEKTKVIDSIIDQMTTNVKAENLQTLTQITSVIGRATANPDEVSFSTQDETIKSLKEMTNLLVEKSEDESASEDYLVDASGENLALSLGNMMKSGSRKANVNEEKHGVQQSKQSTKVTEDSVDLVNKVGESLLRRKVIGEKPSVVRTSSLSMVLGRQTPNDVKNMTIQEGETGFVLPSGNVLDTTIAKSKFIDSQMTLTDFNPFTWDASANLVDSDVSSLVLRNDQGNEIPVQNLARDIQISIPRSHPSNSTLLQGRSFLKPKEVRNYKFIVDYPGKALELQITTVRQPSVHILVKYKEKTSQSSNDFMALLSSLPSCSQDQIFKACRKENGRIFLSSLLLDKQGVYYVGILLGTSTPHKRTKRSCFGHGRQKRSCVEPKDAPQPENRTIIPSYDPNTDVNYSISTQEYNCMFWDGKKWTSKGCKAGSNSSAGTLHCLCNHLTSFGGSLLVAPNPIDFDVVLLELLRLDQTGNIAVLTTILVFLLIYLVVAVIARREDRRDEKKFGPPLPVNPGDPGEYHYEMTIITGIWRNCGTTANVVIEIQGSQAKSHNIILSRDMEPSRIMLASGNADKFIMTLPESLGAIDYLNVWHDNSGSSPSWFLDQIIIKDIDRDISWLFLHRDWFALEKGDGRINKVLLPASPLQMRSFQHKFNYQTSKKFTEEHIWLSVVTKPPHSNFTRLQRATCCLCVLFSAMVVNAMFYKLDNTPDPGVQIGPLKFNTRQITVGIYSSLIVVPVGLLIIFMFRNSRAKNTTKKRTKSKMKSTICDYMCCHIGGSAKNKVYDKNELLVTSNLKSASEANISETSHNNNACEESLHDDTTTISSVILQADPTSGRDQNIGISSENVIGIKNQEDGIKNQDYKAIAGGSKIDSLSETTILKEGNVSKTRETTIKYESEKEECTSVDTVDTTIHDGNEEQKLVPEETSSSTSKNSYKNLFSRFLFAKDDSSKGQFTLPHGFIYISWVLCFVTVIVSASFTFMYSLQWGKEIANRWLSSMLVSFSEDLFVVQPVKICITAIFMAIFFQNKNLLKETSKNLSSKPSETISEVNSKNYMEKSNMKCPEESELKDAKDYQVKEEKMFSFVREAALFGTFLTLLAIVCYGNRSYYGYEMTKTVKNEFSNFSKLTTSDKYWKWINTQYAQSAYAGQWYNNAPESNEVYIGNKMSVLIGMPRIRQLRVKPDSCVIPKKARSITSTCFGRYSFEDEETNPLFLPGWTPFHNKDGLAWANLSQLCPKPWRYTKASDLPSLGLFHAYSGGGYMAELGYNNKTTQFVTNPLNKNKWIDARTRALLLEMSIFNPNTNQLSAITFFYEALPITFGHPFRVVETIALYGTESASYDFFLVSKLLFIFLVIFYLVREARRAFKLKQKYFKSFWNWFEIIKVLVAFVVVVCYVVKEKMLLTAVQRVKENPYLTVNFQPALAWKNAEEAALSLAIFISTINILRMLRFNPHVIIFSASLKSARETLLVYTVILSFVMVSFALVEWLTLGTSMYQYHTIVQALYSQLLMSLGAKMHLNAMKTYYPILGPLFGFAYKVLMTFLFVNFYISVLNDSYEEVKSNTDTNSKEFEMSDFMLERLKEMFFRKTYNINAKEGESLKTTDATNKTILDDEKSPSITTDHEASKKQAHPDTRSKDRNVSFKVQIEECELASGKNISKKPKGGPQGHCSKRAQQNIYRMRRALRNKIKKEKHIETILNAKSCEMRSKTNAETDMKRTPCTDLYDIQMHRDFDDKCSDICGRTNALRKDDQEEDIEFIQLVLLFSKYFIHSPPEEELEMYTPDWVSSPSLSSEQTIEDESCETYNSDDIESTQEELWGSTAELLKNLSMRNKPIPDHLRFSNSMQGQFPFSSTSTSTK